MAATHIDLRLTPADPKTGRRQFYIQAYWTNYNAANILMAWKEVQDILRFERVKIDKCQIQNSGTSVTVSGYVRGGDYFGFQNFDHFIPYIADYAYETLEELEGFTVIRDVNDQGTFISFFISGYAATDDFFLIIQGEVW